MKALPTWYKLLQALGLREEWPLDRYKRAVLKRGCSSL